MSDVHTHFKKETVHLVYEELKVPHPFTLPYCPWSNGTVKRVGKEFLCVLRSVLSELKMEKTEWPDLIPQVTYVLSN